MPSRTRRYFLGFFAKGNNSFDKQQRKKLAYKNSLKKTKSSEDAVARNLLARDLKIYPKQGEGRTAAKRMSVSVKASAKKLGWGEAHRRILSAELLRDGRENDRRGEWGLSFNAGLKELKAYYRPINLTNEIDEYIKKRKIQRARFLEIGAGSGKTISEIEELFGKKLEAIATGLTPVEDWKRFENTKNIKWRIAHAENLRRVARSGSIDIIHSNLGIQHAHRFEIALREANRLLKTGGLFIFSIERTPLTEKVPMPKNFELVKQTNKIIRFDEAETELFVYVLKKK